MAKIVFLCLLCVFFFQNNNRFPGNRDYTDVNILHVIHTTDHRNYVKMFKTLQGNHLIAIPHKFSTFQCHWYGL